MWLFFVREVNGRLYVDRCWRHTKEDVYLYPNGRIEEQFVRWINAEEACNYPSYYRGIEDSDQQSRIYLAGTKYKTYGSELGYDPHEGF